MRIAYLSVFYPYRGGISQFNASLFRALEKGNEVKAYNFSRQYPDFLFPGKTQYVTSEDIADKIPTERVLDSINVFSFFRTAREIEKFKPDLLLIQYWTPITGPALGYVAKYFYSRDIPVISLMANVKPHEKVPMQDIINKIYIRQNHGFVVLAEAVRKDLLEYEPEAEVFLHPHPNYEHFGSAMDMKEARHKLNIPEGSKVLLFFGFIRKYKGLDILLESMGRLGDEYHLIIAGESYGPFDEYDALIEKNGLTGRVCKELKYLRDDEISVYFSAADVCCLPYHSATQSGIVGIAYHFGLPVISTDVGGLREVIEPFGTGLIVPKPEPEAFSKAIRKYFEDKISESFRANVSSFREKYNWDTLARGIVDFAQKIRQTI